MLRENIVLVSFGRFIWLRRQLCSGRVASACCDWQALLIGIDAATRCVSMLWLFISPGTQRRPRPPPSCYHRFEMGVTVITSALCSVHLRDCDLTCVCMLPSSSACLCVGVRGCPRVSHHPDCIAAVFTSAPLLHPLISHSTPTHLSPPAPPLNLHSTQNKCLQWQLHKCWVARLKYHPFPVCEKFFLL